MTDGSMTDGSMTDGETRHGASDAGRCLPAPVLVGCSHGTDNADGQAAIRTILEGVARLRPALRLREAFVDVQRPEVADVVARALAEEDGAPGPEPAVVVVPLLLSTGFHIRVDIAEATRHPSVRAAAALGPHPLLVDILAERLDQAGAGPDDAVVLAAAGSTDPRAADDVERVAAQLRSRRPGPVTVGYGSGAEPRVPAAVAAARASGAPRVVVASYLLAPGFFHDRLRESGAAVVTAPLAPDDRLARIVVERYDAAAAG